MKKTKKAIAAILAMSCAFTPLMMTDGYNAENFVIHANAEEVSYSGMCGENCTYSFDSETGTLTISGTGDMNAELFTDDSSHYLIYPWESYKSEIKSIVIEDGVTSISHNAFSYLDNLINISIADSVTETDGSFLCCSNLKSVKLSDSLTAVDGFAGCTSLEEITIPEGVEEIKYCAFDGCTSLKEVTIPDSVTSVDYRAFADCTALETINYTGEVPSYIDSCAFLNVPLIYDCESDWVTVGDTLLLYKGTDENVVIPDYITKIGAYAFAECNTLKILVIPDTVTKIGAYAFMKCKNLTTVEMADSVTYIDEGAFNECSSLEYVKFSSSITEIPPLTFGGCNFKTIEIPETVTSIGCGAFFECSSATEVKIPDSVEKIDTQAFELCSNVEKYYIPSSVKYIGANALGCELKAEGLITHIYYDGTEEQWNNIEIVKYHKSTYSDSYYYVIEDGVMHFNDETDILGDINGDKIIDVRDNTRLVRYILEMETPENIQINNADIMKDGVIDIKDLGQLNKYIIRVIDKF